jgi:hypothetical protein
MAAAKDKYKSLLALGIAGVVCGLLGAIAPALTELGLALAAAGAAFCVGAWAGRQGVKGGAMIGVILGLVLAAAIGRNYSDNPSFKSYQQRAVSQPGR